MKRVFDIVISLISLVLLSPILLIAAVAIKCDTSGPIIYKQTRVGRHCQLFGIYKFRSMISNADQIGGYATQVGDARITRVGRILRKTSIDELPQLLNVLFGHMSLVGPRPDVPAQEANYTPEDWQKRHRVRPGITGLAQATVRSFAAPGERTRLDLAYVDQVSLGRDLQILWLTVRQVVSRGGY